MKTKRPPSTSPSLPEPVLPPLAEVASSLPEKHLRIGWWALLLFLTMGLALEVLHAFKVEAYLKVSNETRRLMWTLAHAHGTLLGLVNLAFGFTVKSAALDPSALNVRAISSALIAASVLLPGGFFLGGIAFYGGEPGLGVLLGPFG